MRRWCFKQLWQKTWAPARVWRPKHQMIWVFYFGKQEALEGTWTVWWWDVRGVFTELTRQPLETWLEAGKKLGRGQVQRDTKIRTERIIKGLSGGLGNRLEIRERVGTKHWWQEQRWIQRHKSPTAVGRPEEKPKFYSGKRLRVSRHPKSNL